MPDENKLNIETDYWEAIKNRLHEESALQHPDNGVAPILKLIINYTLNKFSEDNILFLDQGFILTASGLYLDIYGHELGLPRKEGEYATGIVEFSLNREIPKTQEPVKLENEVENGIVYDYRPEEFQTLLDRINAERIEDDSVETIFEVRPATNTFTIPEGTSIFSETGFEYLLLDDVTFNKGDTIREGRVKALESGQRYNVGVNELILFNADSVDKDLAVTNPKSITGGKDGESDTEYGQRLLNNNSVNISVNYLKRQGIVIYTKGERDEDIRTKMTSFNPYLFNEYALIPPNNEVADYTLHELIVNDWTMVYIKGW